MNNRAVGIDLGTTFSAIAHVNRHGVPEILHNAEGDRITPSVILFDGDEVIVGNYARQSAVAFPDQVVEFVKRHMGDPDYAFTWRGERYTAERLSSFILARLRHDAELRLGHPVDQAVITVPAYFGDRERRATIRAGELAGLEVLQLVNEPTAAAYAYGLAHSDRRLNCLVFDLGGGTFDVTLVDIDHDEIHVIGTAGDHQLGGKDWDDALVAHAAGVFRERYGLDPLADPAATRDLRQKCVSAKISLSRRPRVNLFFDHQGRILRLGVSREEFEALTRPLLARTERLTLRVLDEARVDPGEVDAVILAGGSTRMPMVRELVRRVFGREPATDINPDECVALGAALSAALESARRTGERPPVDLRAHDVTGHSLGMVVLRDGRLHNSPIIRRNSRIPCERTRDDYATTRDGQTSIDLWLVQGESPDPLACNVLGHFEFYGIPPRPAGESRLAVTYRYNANGIVEVEAMDLGTGQNLAHRLVAGELTLEDLAHGRVPLDVALVMDCSGSMYGAHIREARKAARGFVSRAFRPHRRFAVVAFPGGVKTEPTSDPERIDAAIAALTPIGGTPLHRGLAEARRVLGEKVGVQRVFVVLTDGHPDDPRAAAAEAERIKRAGGRVITVGVGRHVRQDYLRRLASRPADYRFCDQSVELEETFLNIATELSPGGPHREEP